MEMVIRVKDSGSSGGILGRSLEGKDIGTLFK